MEYTVKTKGVAYTAQIDDCDSDLLDVKWYRHKDKSAELAYMNRNEDGVTLVMHRVIMERILGRDLERHEIVGHVDLDGLNNTRENLYLADRYEVRRKAKSATGVKGVQKSRNGKYEASFIRSGVWHYVGTFDTVEEAAAAYAIARSDAIAKGSRTPLADDATG